MAAHRNGIKNVILPIQNKPDIKEIPSDLRSQLTIHFAETVHEYLMLALEQEVDHDFLKWNNANFSSEKL